MRQNTSDIYNSGFGIEGVRCNRDFGLPSYLSLKPFNDRAASTKVPNASLSCGLQRLQILFTSSGRAIKVHILHTERQKIDFW